MADQLGLARKPAKVARSANAHPWYQVMRPRSSQRSCAGSEPAHPGPQISRRFLHIFLRTDRIIPPKPEPHQQDTIKPSYDQRHLAGGRTGARRLGAREPPQRRQLARAEDRCRPGALFPQPAQARPARAGRCCSPTRTRARSAPSKPRRGWSSRPPRRGAPGRPWWSPLGASRARGRPARPLSRRRRPARGRRAGSARHRADPRRQRAARARDARSLPRLGAGRALPRAGGAQAAPGRIARVPREHRAGCRPGDPAAAPRHNRTNPRKQAGSITWA